jgi:hypothetical protein
VFIVEFLLAIHPPSSHLGLYKSNII